MHPKLSGRVPLTTLMALKVLCCYKKSLKSGHNGCIICLKNSFRAKITTYIYFFQVIFVNHCYFRDLYNYCYNFLRKNVCGTVPLKTKFQSCCSQGFDTWSRRRQRAVAVGGRGRKCSSMLSL